MHTQTLTTIVLSSLLLAGCDNSYHTFDGKTGYQVSTIGTEKYKIAFYGHPHHSVKDIQQLWQHAAREVCRGSYSLQALEKGEITSQASEMHQGTVIPSSGRLYLKGTVNCLAGSLAGK